MKSAAFDRVANMLPPLRYRLVRRFQDEGRRWIGPALSVAILAVVASYMGDGVIAALYDAPIGRPALWCSFSLFYLAPITAEWVIFHGLWALPVHGVVPLLRKQIANELVLGYSGDAQFYLWAKACFRKEQTPFKAVKDVAILSAVAGNCTTLILMALCTPLLVQVASGPFGRALAGSVFVIAASSLILFGLRRTIFSLSQKELVFVFVVHVLRILICLLLLAVVVHVLVPNVFYHELLLLTTLRMMLSRLPLLPAKDALFAGTVGVVFDRHAEVVAAISLTAALTVALHLLLGAFISLPSLKNAMDVKEQP